MAMDTEELIRIEKLRNPEIIELKKELANISKENDDLTKQKIEPKNELEDIRLRINELIKRSMTLSNKTDKTTEELKEESEIAIETSELMEKNEEYNGIMLKFNEKINENISRRNEIEKEIINLENKIEDSLKPHKKSISGNVVKLPFLKKLERVKLNKRKNEISLIPKNVLNVLNRKINASQPVPINQELKEKIENAEYITIVSESFENNPVYKAFLDKIEEEKIIDKCIENIENFENKQEQEEKSIDENVKFINDDNKEEENIAHDDNENAIDLGQKIEINTDEEKNEVMSENNPVINEQSENSNEIENDSVDVNTINSETIKDTNNKVMDIIKYELNKISVATPQRLKERVIPNFINTGSKRLDYIVKKYNDKVVSVVSKSDYLEAQKLGIDILSPTYSYKDAYSDKMDTLREISENAKSIEEYKAATNQVANIFNNNFNKDVVDDMNNKSIDNSSSEQIKNIQNFVNSENTNFSEGKNIFENSANQELPKAM